MRASRWFGFAVLALVLWPIVASFLHVFQSANSAARKTRYLQAGKALALALKLYLGSNDDRLPGLDWRRQIGRFDPGIALSWDEGGRRIGFAAMPGTLGKRLAGFPDDAVLFALSRWDSDLSVLDDPRQIDHFGDPKRTFVLTAKNVREGYASRPVPLAHVIAAFERDVSP